MSGNNTELQIANAVQDEKLRTLVERVNRLENTISKLFYLLLANLTGLILLLVKNLI